MAAAAHHGISETVKVSRRLTPGKVMIRHCLDLARCRISGIRGGKPGKADAAKIDHGQ